jgi:hypothetical protein
MKVHRFYKKAAMEHILFGYVRGLKDFASLGVERSVRRFLEEFDIPKEEISLPNGMSIYNRMVSDYFGSEKTLPDTRPRGDFDLLLKVDYVAMERSKENTTLLIAERCCDCLYFIDGKGYKLDEISKLPDGP